MADDPRRAPMSPRQTAIRDLTALVTQVPWALVPEDFTRAREAGLSDETVLHVVIQSAFFNYLNRVADATGLEFDFPIVVEPPPPDATREPLARPDPAEWPRPRGGRLALEQRPVTAERYGLWRRTVLERDAPLRAADRRVLAHAAARSLCDAEGVRALAGPEGDPRLSVFATKITETPWRLEPADRQALADLDDAAYLEAVALVAFQNTDSRIRLALAQS